LVSRGSRLRRKVRSVPIVGELLQSALISYHRKRAEVVDACVDFKDRRLPMARDTTAVAVGSSLSERARRLLLFPYRNERVDLPPPLLVGERRFDVVADLREFTALQPASVHALIARRIENFRTEWLQLPAPLRDDRWFYLSSRMYLFANAVHFHEAPEVIDEIAALLPPGGHVLDFGGGTGNLALALAAHGFRVDYRELSALQKEFARFRVHRYGLQERVEILDSWSELPPKEYDAVCAFDVLEHLPDLAHVVEKLAPSLAEGGVLIDTPSFGAGPSNPMHYEDPGLGSLLANHGLVLDRTSPAFRVWAKPLD
jgi:SAM-dependent methyltransferase